jgi:hypothetical protein
MLVSYLKNEKFASSNFQLLSKQVITQQETKLCIFGSHHGWRRVPVLDDGWSVRAVPLDVPPHRKLNMYLWVTFYLYGCECNFSILSVFGVSCIGALYPRFFLLI